jgi:hypothetical protein
VFDVCCLLFVVSKFCNKAALHSPLSTPMQGNGYTIIYTALIITAILQFFVRLGIELMLLKEENVNYKDIHEFS